MSKFKLILVLSAVLLVGFAAVYLFSADHPPLKGPLSAQQNSKALIGGAFSLVDHHGKKVTDKDFRGKYMLIYFGYTYCPDVCPTELQIIADALDLLPENILAEITPIFITVDPQRDTVGVMAQYVAAFHPKLVGLTGSVAQIISVKKAYRVYAVREKLPEGSDPKSYLMSHTSYIYLMDRKGEYVTHFSAGTTAEMMAKRVQEIIR